MSRYVRTSCLKAISSSLACLPLLLAAAAAAQQSREPPKLPEGDTGLAAMHPGDVGLAQHEQVVFVENFNDSLAAIKARWDSVAGEESLSLSDDRPAGSVGEHALLVTHVGGQEESLYLYRRLQPGYEKLHYRFYVKFDRQSAPMHHFFHVGGYHPPTAWPQGGAGQRPRGDRRFTTGVEPFGSAWRWDFYSYWMDMRGSPPRGQTWGNSFLRDDELKVTRGQWQCLELMMKLNDVGQTNGEMALWLDGRLAGHLGPGFPRGKWVFDKFFPGEGGSGQRWNDQRNTREQVDTPPGGAPFEGFRWRSDEQLKLNFLWLLCFITRAPEGHESKIYFDDVVVAREYIGPLKQRQ